MSCEIMLFGLVQRCFKNNTSEIPYVKSPTTIVTNDYTNNVRMNFDIVTLLPVFIAMVIFAVPENKTII